MSNDDDDINAEPAKPFVIDIELLLLLRRRRALLAHLPPPRIKAPHKHHWHEHFSSFVNAVSLINCTRTVYSTPQASATTGRTQRSG